MGSSTHYQLSPIIHFPPRRRMAGISSLTAVLLLTAGALVAVLALLFFKQLDSVAAVGFLGIIIGGGIATATTLLTARDNRRHQLAMAAVDRRLEAHQTAYALWHRIVGAVHKPDHVGEVLIEADEWWRNNCLYLDPESRKALRDCIIFASSHKDLLAGPRSEEIARLIKESWATIMKPGDTLVRGAALPSLGEAEQPTMYLSPNRAMQKTAMERR